MKTREQHLEEQIERMDQSRDQYSRELNIVADLVKERNALRAELEHLQGLRLADTLIFNTEFERVSKAAAEMRDALEVARAKLDSGGSYGIEWATVVHALSSDAGKDYVKRQSPAEPPASTSGTAVPVEAGPALCASDLPACDTSSNTPSGLTTVPDTGACTSGDVPLTTEDALRIVRIFRDIEGLQRDASSAKLPSGGRQDNGGASQA